LDAVLDLVGGGLAQAGRAYYALVTCHQHGEGLAVSTAEGGEQLVIGGIVHNNLLSPVAARV
jgi:hypothetical protein